MEGGKHERITIVQGHNDFKASYLNFSRHKEATEIEMNDTRSNNRESTLFHNYQPLQIGEYVLYS